jgi:hypothetical protein
MVDDFSSKLGPQTSFYATQLDEEERGGRKGSLEEMEGQTDIDEEKPHAEA